MRILVSVLIVILALPSLLILFPAPLNLLWRLKIGATELGYFMAIPLCCLSVFLFLNGSFRFFGFLGISAAFIYLIPLFKAILLASHLQIDLEKAYGKTEKQSQFPINFLQLIGVHSKPGIEAQSLIYSNVDGENLNLDIYSYSTQLSQLKPCIVSVHGGAWVSGDNKMFVDFNKDFASKGYVVADVNYALAPNHIFPVQEHNIIDAIEYLKLHAAQFQIDTNQIFLLGRSAGGQIAAVTAFHLGKSKIKGLICFYTPLDMVWGYSFPGNPLILDSRKVLREYLGGSFEDAKANFYASSPVHQVNTDSPPILMLHGESDEMVAYQHNLRLIDKIQGMNISYHLVSLPCATHGFDYFHNSQNAQLSTYAIDYFLERYGSK